MLESRHALSQAGQFGQSGFGAAAAVKEAIGLVHDLPQGPQGRQAARDSLQDLAFGGAQVALDEQMAMLEQVGDLGLDPFLAGGQTAVGLGGTAPADLRQGGL